MLKAGFVLDGKYRILSVIGQGGMSTVYLAVHERLKQKWAVKEISMEYCENYEMISRKLIVEADILKRLDHPGLPKIVDIIEKKDAIWMVMEFIEGKTLKEILNERGRIEEKEILIWGKQLCEVLSYLHSKKPSIIYRDLKPENIILKKTGRLVLIDFGTAREYCYKNTACDAMYLGTKGYAVILLDLINSVCEEGTVIEIFQKHNALGYAEFSYALGLGYFYDMGNITGKGASEKWFCEAIDTMTSQDENEAFGKQKRKRAGLYAKIANYYNTFLLNGTDQSGERGTGDFMDFYKTLHSLNQFEVTQKSTKSDLAAAYLISREITIEIMNYAEQFLKDSSINKKMLNKELEKIEERTKYFIKEKKQMEELYQFMNEAKQKIEIADSFKDKEDVRDAGGT